MNNIKETANVKETANNIGFMLDCYASFLLKTLPETLTRKNLHSFLKAFNCIESVTEYGYETAKKSLERWKRLHKRLHVGSLPGLYVVICGYSSSNI